MFKKLLFTLLTLSTIGCVNTALERQNEAPGGDTATLQGIKILFLSGNHYERGFQHGNLLGPAIMDVFEGALLQYMCKSRKSLYDSARTFMQNHFTFEEKYISEAEGMIAGMNNAGISLYDTILTREIDYYDLLVLSGYEELYNITDFIFGCSSISSWGASTMQDSLLREKLIITRHWDYPEIPAMIRNLLLIVHKPSESNEYDWVSCNWAGMIGSCSAMNEKGLGAFLDYGDYLHEETPNLSTHHPVSLSIRNGIEYIDYNGDDSVSVMDIYHAVEKFIPYFGSLIHVVSTAMDETRAIIVESDNKSGITFRSKSDNTEVPGDNLAVTNHYRTLYQPASCSRYRNIVDSLKNSVEISIERSWLLLAGAGASSHCRYCLSYIPSLGIIRYSVTTLADPIPAYDRPSGHFTMDLLFHHF